MSAALSFLGFLMACFMRYGVISCMFWLCYMMLAIQVFGQKTANPALNTGWRNKAAPAGYVRRWTALLPVAAPAPATPGQAT